jgi:Tol biopolymer transport system component
MSKLSVITLLFTAAVLVGRPIPIQRPFQSEQPARKTVLWTGADVGNVQSISPDGRMLAYIDRNPPGVAVRDLTTGTNRILARSVSETAREIVSESAGQVVFSADGRRVAYSWAKHREDRYEVRITPVRDGGSLRVVATMPAGSSIRVHDWSRDGTWIAVERTAASAGTSIEYLVVNAAEGTSRVLKTVEGAAPTSRLAFSPDGGYLAYDRPATIDSDQHDVFVVSVDTGADTAHVASPADETVAGWSPDGRYLLFTSEQRGRVDLRGQPMIDGSMDGPARTLQVGVAGTPVGVTAAGGVAMIVTVDPATVYSVEVNAETGAVLGAPTPLSDRRWPASWAPNFSADGRRFSYLSRVAVGPGPPSGGPPRPFLSINSLDSGRTTILPLKLLSIAGYDWVPDGRTIVAMASDLQDRYGVHLIDVVSGATTPIALATGVFTGTRYTGPQGAGSGRRVYYTRTPRGDLAVRTAAKAGIPTAPTHTLLERNLDTGEERVFLEWSQVRTADGSSFAAVRQVQVSPDDQWVAALGTVQGSGAQLWVVSVQEKIARALPLELESGPFPISNEIRWTPDGGAILINRRQGTGREATRSLWLVPVDGSNPVRLAIDMQLQDLAAEVHPDGRQIVFVSGSGRNREIRLLEGVLPPPR